MRLLVLGGTVFLGHAVATEAVRRGHEVVCGARGESGGVPAGARHVPVDRNAPDGLAPLAGERFDAVVDTARMSVNWVRDALRVLGPGAGHWTFVSSCSVYLDQATLGQTVNSPTLPALEDDADADPGDLYGGVKVASENAVRDVFGKDAFLVRAGLITGPGDLTDRFGYWPARLSRGGRVLVPDTPEQAAQHIDVRDLASWIVDGAERRIGGAYDTSGPVHRLGDLLAEIAEAVAPDGTELVPVPGDKLVEAGVHYWSGPRSLPMWLGEDHLAMLFRDVSNARSLGLTPRPTADTARDSLAYERTLGLDRERNAGLTAAEEAELLDTLG